MKTQTLALVNSSFIASLLRERLRLDRRGLAPSYLDYQIECSRQQNYRFAAVYLAWGGYVPMKGTCHFYARHISVTYWWMQPIVVAPSLTTRDNNFRYDLWESREIACLAARDYHVNMERWYESRRSMVKVVGGIL